MEWLTAEQSVLARWLFERGLAVLYLLAFLNVRNQFPALLGEHGLLPVPAFLRRSRFRTAPSLFHWRYSDRLLLAVAWTGMALSAAILAGALDHAPILLHMAVWLVLYGLYLSVVNVGQRFYAFGWESMLLEAGFFAAFLGPAWLAPSWIPLLFLRWMLFRVELGAGLIKLRHDRSWRDLTALYYHHETQPLPNPLSRVFHRLPRRALRGGVAFSHLVQVGVPFLLWLPQPFAGAAALLVIGHQGLLIVAGNYAWLNWLTIVLAVVALPDAWLALLPGLLEVSAPSAPLAPRPLWLEAVHGVLLVFGVWLSVEPLANLFSKQQKMNYSWNAWHLVCAYGAFGSMTKVRYEIVVEGTRAERPDPDADWQAYGFRAKPGDPRRRPPQVAPYHLRLDWLMWFLPFSVSVAGGRVHVPGYEPWFLRFVGRLLEGDAATRRLLREDPFGDAPPRWIRARYARYRFTTAAERRAGAGWWSRDWLGDYLPPVSRESLPD